MKLALENGGDIPQYGTIHRLGCRDLIDPEYIGEASTQYEAYCKADEYVPWASENGERPDEGAFNMAPCVSDHLPKDPFVNPPEVRWQNEIEFLTDEVESRERRLVTTCEQYAQEPEGFMKTEDLKYEVDALLKARQELALFKLLHPSK